MQGRTAGDDDGRQSHEGQHQSADNGRRARQPEKIEENGQSQQPEHDRGHSRQVVDIDLDQFGEFVVRGKLFQIDGGSDCPSKSSVPETMILSEKDNRIRIAGRTHLLSESTQRFK